LVVVRNYYFRTCDDMDRQVYVAVVLAATY
jgi:hypothetical protein